MTGWTAPPRTEAAAAAHATAEADRQARPEAYRLDPDEITRRACRRPGDEDRLPPGWREGLEQYLGSARQDGRLSALGTGMVRSAAIGRLRSGIALARHHEEGGEVHPLAAPPIVIIGGWRTGTTFLFRLLATDPRLRGPLPAELVAPCSAARRQGAERDAFLDSGAHDVLHLLNPTLRAVHDSGPRLPEECVLGMGTDLRSWGFTSTVRLDAYAAWLEDQDLHGTYQRYRQLLEVLDRGDGRRWVLKAPAHTAELPHLVAAFPGAVVVHLHRDIVETVASGSSLFAVFRSTYSDEVDGVDVGRYQAHQTERWFRRAHAFRSAPAAAAATFVDVEYEDLVSDPVGTIEVVYRAAAMDPPPDPAGFVTAYQQGNPHHGHGIHRYSAEDFGLDPDELRERFAFLGRRP